MFSKAVLTFLAIGALGLNVSAIPIPTDTVRTSSSGGSSSRTSLNGDPHPSDQSTSVSSIHTDTVYSISSIGSFNTLPIQPPLTPGRTSSYSGTPSLTTDDTSSRTSSNGVPHPNDQSTPAPSIHTDEDSGSFSFNTFSTQAPSRDSSSASGHTSSVNDHPPSLQPSPPSSVSEKSSSKWKPLAMYGGELPRSFSALCYRDLTFIFSVAGGLGLGAVGTGIGVGILEHKNHTRREFELESEGSNYVPSLREPLSKDEASDSLSSPLKREPRPAPPSF